MRILSAAQMREADRRTIEEVGLPSIVLMENAGREVVAAMDARYGRDAEGRVAVLAGIGNNGGDGFVTARALACRGRDVTVWLIGASERVQGDARLNLELLTRLGVPLVRITSVQEWERYASDLSQFDVVVDALFGTGLSHPLTGLYETVVSDVNASGLPVVSIDLPSGLSADSNTPIGPSVQATMTVTMAALKRPLVMAPVDRGCGEVVVADIGIPPHVIDGLEGDVIELLTRASLRTLVVPRDRETHKGESGRVLIVAGSVGKTGAAHLAALGALRSGAGLVTVATPRSCVGIIAAMAPEYMTLPLVETADGQVTREAADQVLAVAADVIAAGPGLGAADGAAGFVDALLAGAHVPLVLDADALNVLARHPDLLKGSAERPVIVTPHPGEMARLAGTSIELVQAERLDAARQFAAAHGVHVILKGHASVVASPNGRMAVNPTGNPGMATGGTGDVLTGVVAAWLAQLRDAEAAARLSVYLHGLAGDLAEARTGETAMIASDLAAQLGPAVLELTARRPVTGPRPGGGRPARRW